MKCELGSSSGGGKSNKREISLFKMEKVFGLGKEFLPPKAKFISLKSYRAGEWVASVQSLHRKGPARW